MKHSNRLFAILFVISLIILNISCKHSSEPEVTIPSVTHTTVQLEIIPDTTLPKVLDSTFYTHDPSWGWDRFFDTTAANKFADSLCAVPALITDMWFPNQRSIGGGPMRVGSEVKVKLASPDTSITIMGLQRTGERFIPFINKWRHYKFTRSPGTA
jgi:hypothetical protein